MAWKSVTAGDDSPDESVIARCYPLLFKSSSVASDMSSAYSSIFICHGRFVNVIMVVAGMVVMATLFGLIDETMRDKVSMLCDACISMMHIEHAM